MKVTKIQKIFELQRNRLQKTISGYKRCNHTFLKNHTRQSEAILQKKTERSNFTKEEQREDNKRKKLTKEKAPTKRN